MHGCVERDGEVWARRAFNVLNYCLPSIALIYLFVEFTMVESLVLYTHTHYTQCAFLCDKEQPCPINWPPDIYRTYYECVRGAYTVYTSRSSSLKQCQLWLFCIRNRCSSYFCSRIPFFPPLVSTPAHRAHKMCFSARNPFYKWLISYSNNHTFNWSL